MENREELRENEKNRYIAKMARMVSLIPEDIAVFEKEFDKIPLNNTMAIERLFDSFVLTLKENETKKSKHTVLFGMEAVDIYQNGNYKTKKGLVNALERDGAAFDIVTLKMNDEEFGAYIKGINNCLGWEDYQIISVK